MGELTISTFLSLDGVMQAPGGPTEDPSGGFAHGGWLVPYFDDGMGEAMTEIFTKIENDLIDEYRLFIFPVVLGSGKRLFGAGTVPAALTLVRSHTTGSGVLASIYRRAGGLKTGSL